MVRARRGRGVKRAAALLVVISLAGCAGDTGRAVDAALPDEFWIEYHRGGLESTSGGLMREPSRGFQAATLGFSWTVPKLSR